MRIWAAAVAMVFILGCQPADEPTDASATPARLAPPDGLQGAWRLTEIEYVAADGSVTGGTPQESLLYFGAGYYFMGYSHHETPSRVFDDPWSPTPDEALERASGLVVNSGRYELTEGGLLLHPDFAWYPVVVGSRAIIEAEVVGDALVLTYIDQVGVDGVSDPYYAGGAKYVLSLERMR